jgi:hypothetical protein
MNVLTTQQVADLLCDLADVGATIDRFQGVATLVEGYVVGGEVKALELDNRLSRWYKVNATELWLEKLPIGQRLVGSWVDGDTLYVDAVRVEHDIDRAMELAYERRERAIYDVRKNRPLYVTLKEES